MSSRSTDLGTTESTFKCLILIPKMYKHHTWTSPWARSVRHATYHWQIQYV